MLDWNSSHLEVNDRTMFVCKICSRKFRDSFNLKRHMETVHGDARQDSTMDEDEDDADSAQSEDSRPEDVSETGSNASDTDNSDADSAVDDDDDDDEDAVFADILQRVKDRYDDPDSLSHKHLQKLFRAEYRDTVLWLHKLKQNPTHQIVMQTAKDFRDGPYDYDYEESIDVAVDQRKHLLNRLVPEEEDDNADNAESMAS